MIVSMIIITGTYVPIFLTYFYFLYIYKNYSTAYLNITFLPIYSCIMTGTRNGAGTGTGRASGREPFSASRSLGNLTNYSSPWESDRSDRTMTYGRNNGFDGGRNSGFDGNKNNGYENLRSNVFDGTRSLNLTPRLSTGPPSPIHSDSRGRQGHGHGLFGNMSLNTTQGFGSRERGSVSGSGPVSSSGRGGRQGDVLYDHVMSSVIERVAIAAIDRSRTLGSPFSLLKQFQVYDDGYGSVSEKVFESTIGTSGQLIYFRPLATNLLSTSFRLSKWIRHVLYQCIEILMASSAVLVLIHLVSSSDSAFSSI